MRPTSVLDAFACQAGGVRVARGRRRVLRFFLAIAYVFR